MSWRSPSAADAIRWRRGHDRGAEERTPGKNYASGGWGAQNPRRQQAPSVSLSDASLKAVQAHRKGATANKVLHYLSREFGMTVRPNHLTARAPSTPSA